MKVAIVSAVMLFGLVGCERARSTPPPASAGSTTTAVAPPMSLLDGDTLAIGGGGVCGTKVCKAGTYCCNASCGKCAPIGGGCTQQACAFESDRFEP